MGDAKSLTSCSSIFLPQIVVLAGKQIWAGEASVIKQKNTQKKQVYIIFFTSKFVLYF